MQYLLTEEEMKSLTDKEEVSKRDEAIKVLREALLEASNSLCIHDEERPPPRWEHYCDNCPVVAISRMADCRIESNRPMLYTLCDLHHNFSK